MHKRTAKLLIAICTSMAVCTAEEAPISTISLQEAVKITVQQDPAIKVETLRTTRSQAQTQAAGGEFDWSFFANYSYLQERSRIANPASPVFKVTRRLEATTSMGMTKLFRNGVRITPSIGVLETDNFLDRNPSVSRSELKLSIEVPLLRGFGSDATAATERAAKINHRAILEDTRHQIAAEVYRTVEAFWLCRAASQKLDIRLDTERRATEMQDVVAKFVDGGEIEPVVLMQARGDLLTKKADTTDARLTLYRTRMQLAVAMGYDPFEQENAPLAGDAFPEVRPSTTVMERANILVQQALTDRGDYIASNRSVEAQDILVKQARNQLLPRLDLTMEGSYLGLEDTDSGSRHYGSVTKDLTGINSYVGLTLVIPLGNNVAKGLYREKVADYDTATMIAAQVAQAVSAEVRISLATLQAAQESYVQAHESVQALKQVVASTRQKVGEGEASLTTLVDQEDKYVTARILEIDALANYTIALARLHLVTGNLLKPGEQDAFLFTVDRLNELP